MATSVDLTINLGNVLTIIGGLVALAVAWGLMKGALMRMDEHITELRADRDKHEHRIRGVEQGNIAIGAKLDALFQMVADIREAVRSRLP